MRYHEFRARILTFLRSQHEGATWKELRARLRLSYKTPCYTWIYRMEEEDGLRRVHGPRGMIWRVERKKAERKPA